MLDIGETIRTHGDKAITFSTYEFAFHSIKMDSIPGHKYYGNKISSIIHYILGRLTAGNGLFSYFATKDLINQIQAFDPDIVHLHNLHNFCVNLPLLFKFLNNSGVKVVWTFHDCWPFTGHCAHFLLSKCAKWKTGCYACPSYREYPRTTIDGSKRMYKLKKKYFTSLSKLTIVTPSEWLSKLLSYSFFKDYPVRVINNGIDLSVFYPRDNTFRTKMHLKDKYIILGVSYSWGYSKGLDIFQKMAEQLPSKFQIVLVGITREQRSEVSNKIISIERTNNREELAEIYSDADVFVNPTREDTFPTVNIEALACGTPVVTYKTGGSPEIIDSKCGIAVETNTDITDIVKKVVENKLFLREDCVRRAQKYRKEDKYNEYYDLFKELTKENF